MATATDSRGLWARTAAGLARPAHPAASAFLVAYGELAIGLALTAGFMVRTASAFGTAFMLALLFSSDHPGPGAALWQYFGASLDHLVLALCFAGFALGRSDQAFSIRGLFRKDGSEVG